MLLEKIKQKCYKVFAPWFTEEEFDWIFNHALCGEFLLEGKPMFPPEPQSIPSEVRFAALEFVVLMKKTKKREFLTDPEVERALKKLSQEFQKIPLKVYHEELDKYLCPRKKN
jgi:hypothetical protein